MKKNSQLTPENFENLLVRLSEDRDQAGVVYEEIRRGLIRFFRIRGCAGQEDLADETINRVARRIEEFTPDESFELIKFCYGFARNIYLEYIAQRRELEFNPDLDYLEPERFADVEEKNEHYKCLEHCLGKIPEDKRQIVIRYYSADKIDKIKLRQKMAEELNLTTRNLHTKVYRMRDKLKKCIKNCLDEK